jgi:hypothetical protein
MFHFTLCLVSLPKTTLSIMTGPYKQPF